MFGVHDSRAACPPNHCARDGSGMRRRRGRWFSARRRLTAGSPTHGRLQAHFVRLPSNHGPAQPNSSGQPGACRVKAPADELLSGVRRHA